MRDHCAEGPNDRVCEWMRRPPLTGPCVRTEVPAERPLLPLPGMCQWEGVARVIHNDGAGEGGPLRAGEGGEAELGCDLTDHRACKALQE